MQPAEKPLYVLKIEAQQAFNANNITNAKRACEAHGIDVDYTIGKAINYYQQRNGFTPQDETRTVFHDALHVISGGLIATAHSEAKVGAYEIALLREPYNGDTNHNRPQAARHYYTAHHVVTRRYNPGCEQNFERPAPHPENSLQLAFDLASERLKYINRVLKQNNTLDRNAIHNAYDKAMDIEQFFSGLMGQRRLYQLSDAELPAIPLAFFGLQNTASEQNPDFEEIDAETRAAISTTLGDQNMVLHKIEAVKTEAELLALTQPQPHQALQSTDPSTLTAG